MELNNLGFVIKDGGLKVFSDRSALSGAPVGFGGLTRPVPGVPGLFYRLAAGEAQLTEAQRADIRQRARAWYAARQPVPVPEPARRRAAARDDDEKSEE